MALKKGKTAPVVEEAIVEDVEVEATADANVNSSQEAVQETPTASVPATQTKSSVPAERNPQGGVLASAEQAGFEGLGISFGSFPVLKLDKGTFVLDDQELEEKSIEVVLLQSRPKYIYKEAGADSTDVFVYSYDQKTTTNGADLNAWLQEQAANGIKVEVKEYLEVLAEVVSPEDYEGELIIMSVPPTSRARFSGYVVKLLHKTGLQPNKVVTQVSVGPRLRKGTISWNPWKFSYVRPVE